MKEQKHIIVADSITFETSIDSVRNKDGSITVTPRGRALRMVVNIGEVAAKGSCQVQVVTEGGKRTLTCVTEDCSESCVLKAKPTPTGKEYSCSCEKVETAQ